MMGPEHRYVFVGGLHRSGTSLVARLIADHPRVAAIRDAPVPENEGCYLQGAIPHTARHGAPMHFATDPAQHLTEESPLNRLETRLRLQADWDPWFDRDRPWRVEKSPVNMTRMRLYQQLFPLSQFIIVIRHPQAVAAAVAKWLPDPPETLIDHWLDAHDRLRQDLTWLHAAAVIRYEDLVAQPTRITQGIFRFLDLPPVPPAGAMRDGNADYPDVPPMTAAQAARAADWGYGPDLRVMTASPHLTHPLRAVAEAARQCWPEPDDATARLSPGQVPS
ncbi:MAG: sulfotransferase [Paracoccus sp. (in: a-proteobacteria)]|uniref:sulfotransferase family protein n=1 Tax=Paracoccus sp. TaxID=267 RepID=UPI0032426699